MVLPARMWTVLVCVATSLARPGDKVKVLSFGGNGNIGSAVLSRLIETEDFDIVMTTRGGWHWDSDTRIGPHVVTVKCNRDYQPPCAADKNATDCDINAVRQCPDLIKIINQTEKFDVVLDFSGYEPKWIHDNCEVLKGKVGVYIYISTDSVYEVMLTGSWTFLTSLLRSPLTSRPSGQVGRQTPSDRKMRRRLVCSRGRIRTATISSHVRRHSLTTRGKSLASPGSV